MWGSVCARRVLGAAAIIGALLPSGVLAQAPRYAQLQAKLTEAQANQAKKEIGSIIRAGAAPTADQQKKLDAFFQGYFFPMMTATDATSLGNLSKMRKDLFQQYLTRPMTPGLRAALAKTTINGCGKIAFGNYHPACRYNAVLIIGSLDDKAEKGQKPVVSPAATSALMILAGPEYKGKPIPTSVNVGALVGLQRHARYGVEAKYAEQLTKTALAVIDRKEIPEDVTASVYDWIRVQAAEVLANQFAEGKAPPAVVEALAKLIGNKEVKLAERCDVAKLVGRMKFAAGGPEGASIGPALAKLVDDVLKDEKKAAVDYQDEVLETSGFTGGFGGGGFGGGEFGGRGGEFGGGFGGTIGPAPPLGPRYEKRRMLQRINSVNEGLAAVEVAAADDLKKRITDMRTVINELVAEAGKRDAIDDDVAKAVVVAARAMSPLVEQWAAPQDEEEPPAEEAFGDEPKVEENSAIEKPAEEKEGAEAPPQEAAAAAEGGAATAAQ